MKSFSIRSLDSVALSALLVLSAVIILSFTLMPRSASAAAVNVTSVTATSSNAATTYAKLGDTVYYQLELDATPWVAPQINIFNLGSTTMTGTTGSWWYSTTTSSTNGWTESAITFQISVGSTTSATVGTTTLTHANLTGSNVTYDVTAPSAATGLSGTVFHGTTSFSLASSGSSEIRYTTSGTAPTCTTGTVYSAAVTLSQSATVKAVGCDAAGNISSVATAVYSPATGGGTSEPVVAPATPATPAEPATPATTAAPATPATPATPASPAATATPASGLSASQIQSILDVLASFDADASTIEGVKASLSGATTGSVTSAAVHVFQKELTVGSLGSEVKALQQFLNARGYTVSASGAGSVGNETETFGKATKAALAKYQQSVGITPASGYFGPKTRTHINSLAQ